MLATRFFDIFYLVNEPYKDYETSANKKPEAETNPRNVFSFESKHYSSSSVQIWTFGIWLDFNLTKLGQVATAEVNSPLTGKFTNIIFIEIRCLGADNFKNHLKTIICDPT